MSQLSGTNRDSRTPSPPADATTASHTSPLHFLKRDSTIPTPSTQSEPFPAIPISPPTTHTDYAAGDLPSETGLANSSPNASPFARPRSTSRPLSMVQTYQPHIMDINADTIPELQPIFTFLNSHGNKLYQEGYFLKLDDQDTHGRPNLDRNWTECFAQLVGTVLSLWDAAELDSAGEDGEVLPKFINLTDASIKMIDSLPTRSTDEQPLQNILSVSTAGRNRYLLHFNSHHSLIQWTSSIRLAMYEQSTLQEAYTGALIAGKGRSVNNINLIMDRSRFKTEEWVRVRFGAGVPWRRCWCVISPPDEKEMQKLQKDMKKRSPYDRSHMPILKGDVKFYDTKKEGKKQKKAKPIATLTNAYAAYAIYPQSKALIDASTLVKIEATISIHTDPPSSTEGFVFVMPEVHPAVSGFEMLLRFLFPTWDTFGLYGRPGRLVASVLDPRSLMFAMPKHRRYGYLEIADVANLVQEDGSATWNEREWRKKLKDLTGQRMAVSDDSGSSETASRRPSNRSHKRLSFGGQNGSTDSTDRQFGGRPKVNFADGSNAERPTRAASSASKPGQRTDSAPPASDRKRLPVGFDDAARHSRNFSDTRLVDRSVPLSNVANGGHVGHTANGGPGAPYPLSTSPPVGAARDLRGENDTSSTPEPVSSGGSSPDTPFAPDLSAMRRRMETPEPVVAPPAFNHAPSSRPIATPYHSAEMRLANNRLSNATLAQLTTPGVAPNGPPGAMNNVQARPPMNGLGPAAEFTARGPPQQQQQAMMGGGPGRGPMGPMGPGYQQGQGPPGQQQRGPPPPNHQEKPPMNMGWGAGQQQQQQQQQRLQKQPPPHLQGPFSPPLTDSRTPSPYSPRGPPPPPQHGGPGPLRMRTPPPQTDNQGVGAALGSPTSPSIHRKPVPRAVPPHEEFPYHLEHESALIENLPDYYINETALDQIQTQTQSKGSTYSDAQFRPLPAKRQDTKQSVASSRYDDTSSTDSPDYASTRESIDTEESRERPRAGVLRTVGETTPVVHKVEDDLGIPEVDFGRTINYAAQTAPVSKAPAPSAMPAGRTPVPQVQDAGHFRDASDDTLKRRSIAWQPGAASAAPQPEGNVLTPEQYVMQRAAQAANSPQYAHQRGSSSVSSSGRMKNTLRRSSSFDMFNSISKAQPQQPQQPQQQPQQQRPSSQGADSALRPRDGPGGGPGSHLSAREQEHLARMTGAPLINMAANPRNQQVGAGAGLVGAIAVREREKQQMKEGFSSQTVQHAINQRQQQQFMQQQQQAMYGGGGPGPQMYNAFSYGGGNGPVGPVGPMPPQQGRPPMMPRQGSMPGQQGWAGSPMPGAWPMAQQGQGQGSPPGQFMGQQQQPGARSFSPGPGRSFSPGPGRPFNAGPQGRPYSPGPNRSFSPGPNAQFMNGPGGQFSPPGQFPQRAGTPGGSMGQPGMQPMQPGMQPMQQGMPQGMGQPVMGQPGMNQSGVMFPGRAF